MVCDAAERLEITDTIAAIATPPATGAIGIVRVSGPHSRRIGERICGAPLLPRRVYYRAFKDPQGAVLDEGLAFFFNAPHSYTGEDMLELQGHGGQALLACVLRRVIALGARHAEPGEFTRRALLNHKLSLYQAEAIADMIAATSERAARAAQRSKQGAFIKRVEAISSSVLALRSRIEAQIDFLPDEDDQQAFWLPGASHIHRQIVALIERAQASVALRQGLKLHLCGAPNVGKSSLFNVLCGQDAAIVNPTPGTTRDVLTAELCASGMQVSVSDSAGIRDTAEAIEAEGVRRALAALEQADLVLLLTAEPERHVPKALHAPLRALQAQKRLWYVHNKTDLSKTPCTSNGPVPDSQPPAFAISLKTGAGVEALRQALDHYLRHTDASEHEFLARERHVALLVECANLLKKCQQKSADGSSILSWDQAAAELTEAHRVLGAIGNPIAHEQLLDQIFADFCIGK